MCFFRLKDQRTLCGHLLLRCKGLEDGSSCLGTLLFEKTKHLRSRHTLSRASSWDNANEMEDKTNEQELFLQLSLRERLVQPPSFVVQRWCLLLLYPSRARLSRVHIPHRPSLPNTWSLINCQRTIPRIQHVYKPYWRLSTRHATHRAVEISLPHHNQSILNSLFIYSTTRYWNFKRHCYSYLSKCSLC